MTEQQKEAIKILNELKYKEAIKDEEYFLLLDFIVKNASVNNYYTPTPFEPLKVWYSKDSTGMEPNGRFGGVTSKTD